MLLICSVILSIFLVIIIAATTYDAVKVLRENEPETKQEAAAESNHVSPSPSSETDTSPKDGANPVTVEYANGSQPGVTLRFKGDTENAQPGESSGDTRMDICVDDGAAHKVKKTEG